MIKLGLIGYPLGHSLSPKLHAAALRACDLQGDFSLYPVDTNDFQSIRVLFDQVRTGELTGLNVTIPHKQNAIQFVDQLTPSARAIGAVNTIYLKDDKLIGDNTDAPGFLTDLTSFLKKDTAFNKGKDERQEKSALIIGAGGSARAVVYALQGSGWSITIGARRIEQAQGIANSHLRITHYDLFHIAQLLSDFQLIVNTTPVGMFPITDVSPWFDGLAFPKGAVLYDLIYNPRETLLVKQARGEGLRATTGVGMLIEQAALSFQIWTGYDISRKVMLDAIYRSDH